MVMVSRPLATAAAFQEQFQLTVNPTKYFDFWSIMMHNGIPRSGTNCPSKSRVGVPITRQFRFWNKSTDLPNLPATSKVTCHGQSTGRLVCPETCVLLLPFLLGPQPHRRVRTDRAWTPSFKNNMITGNNRGRINLHIHSTTHNCQKCKALCTFLILHH